MTLNMTPSRQAATESVAHISDRYCIVAQTGFDQQKGWGVNEESLQSQGVKVTTEDLTVDGYPVLVPLV